MRLISFGDYVFPDQTFLQSNMGELVPRTQRILGRDGGFDTYGEERFRKEVGSLATSFYLQADSPAEMQSKRDEIAKLLEIGRKELVIEPWGGNSLTRRTAFAKLINVQMNESVANTPHRLQQVQMNFQTSEPYFQTPGTAAAYYGEPGVYYGKPGLYYGGNVQSANLSGVSPLVEFTTTINGTARTFPIITATCTTGSVTSFTITRYLDNGLEVEKLIYSDTLNNGDALRYNIPLLSATVNGSAAYAGVTAQRDYWLSLVPGVNNIRAEVVAAGGLTVTIQWRERWGMP